MIYRKAEKTGGLEGILGEKIAVKSGICKKKKKNLVSVCCYCLWENQAGDVWNREIADSCSNFMAVSVSTIGNLNVTFELGMVWEFAWFVFREVNTTVTETDGLWSQIWVQIQALSLPSRVTSGRWLDVPVPQFLICDIGKRTVLTARCAVGTKRDNCLKFLYRARDRVSPQ